VYSLGIKELVGLGNSFIIGAWEIYLSNNLGWFSVVNRFQILLHSTIILPLLIQEVSILSEYDVLLVCVHTGLLGYIDGIDKKISLVQYLKSLL
jgi:hypothetical protein